MLGSFLFLAQDLYVPPATENARDVQALFNITMWIALFVFVFVEGLLLYMVIRFRKNTKVPREETHRGHTTAEVVWTVIPAAILLFLGFLSAGTLVQLDEIPSTTDFTIHVEASQFQWQYYYPATDGTPYNGEADWCAAPNQARCLISLIGVPLRVQEGSTVLLEITSKDVIHAFAIPEFSIKADAVPGKTHSVWFKAPSLGSGASRTYFIQCMEYCGTGHHIMGPSQEAGTLAPKLEVFRAGTQPLAWGPVPPAPAGS